MKEPILHEIRQLFKKKQLYIGDIQANGPRCNLCSEEPLLTLDKEQSLKHCEKHLTKTLTIASITFHGCRLKFKECRDIGKGTTTTVETVQFRLSEEVE